MIRRNTWILLIIMVVLVVFAILFPNIKGRFGKKTGEATPTIGVTNLFYFDTTQVAFLRVQDTSGKILAIRRNESGLWELTEPIGDTDTAAVENIVSQVASLKAMVSLDPSVDIAIYGLSKPAYYITVNLNGGEKHTLVVGDITPTKNGYYVRLDEDPPLVVSKYSLDTIIGMLVKPPFVPTSTPEPTLPITATLTTTVSMTSTPWLTLTPTFTFTSTPTVIITPTVSVSPTLSATITPTVGMQVTATPTKQP